MTATAQLREKGQLTIPAEIRRAAQLDDGALLELELVPEGILLRPVLVVDDVEVDEDFARMVIETTTAGFERMRERTSAWRSELAERRALEGSLPDGLEET